ncbi:MAG TPA: hypothetical protein VGW79_07905, partial [Actinomycetota bacterium]|nr:hypothetical protein [Actinomycetota bacterium]
ISTQGLGGSPDRSLGDFMQVTTGSQGQAVVSYVDDTSADRNPDFCMGCGQSPPEAAGPIMIATQDGGPSLFTSSGPVKGSPPAVGSIVDRSGDAFFSALGTNANAPAALDVTGASVKQADASHLSVTLSTADRALAQHLSVDPSLGGLAGEWIVRWAAPTYDKPGDGNIFYVGMESMQGGAPEFYTGTTLGINTTHVKYFAYPKTTDIPGKIAGNTITWTVPLSAVGHPANGDGLFSVTGFTATQLTPAFKSLAILPNGGLLGDPNIPNTIDSTPPFTFTMPGRSAHQAGSLATAPARPGALSPVSEAELPVVDPDWHALGSRKSHDAGWNVGALIALGIAGALVLRARRRRLQ